MFSKVGKFFLILLLASISLSTLHAEDNFDISFFVGTGTKEWPEDGVSFTYGMNFGLTRHMELSIGGLSSLVPFFDKNMIYSEFSFSLMGPRSRGSKVGTSLITRLDSRLTTCEKKMMYSELRALVFVSMLKK